ncbi:MAG: hypothetical protein IJ637_08400 [Prevotella sp.]|nr:hypothetical protein [Prevotella sp.]
MKKTYIAPITEAVSIETTGMLATSGLGIDSSVEITDESNLLSREFDDMLILGE